ncbi:MULTISPECIES: preprotein translocase subunit YajC [Hymenobacter]|uniref:Sec translocon accessory complex subunit YajC n=1 Tax=Hymenobacter jejuensis TaxID=2502781 RepID=A0A5B8A1H9_9BACT|nr:MULTISPECIES: preprotein translocase subunit YajC [Hymenobacter]MBC6991685.1 preprotein translocase subunit YajC [Hymenobacter sp. BT491]QDA60012.1 preprotein translocase subunit YajC [Hymenobacter jejuensis]
MLLSLLLQAPAGEGYTSLLFPIAIGLVVYFFMIRPQQKRASEAKKFREALTKGATVVTIGGLHGKVVEVNEETVIVEVDRGTRLKFDRTAIAREVASKSSAPAPNA